METCQKRTRCPFLKNGHFSVVFHLISGSVFHLIFLKNELKNGIKNGSKMRTVNTAIVQLAAVGGGGGRALALPCGGEAHLDFRAQLSIPCQQFL
jgi:hypothetical protein